MLRAFHPICLIALTFTAAAALAQSPGTPANSFAGVESPWNGTWKLNQAKSHMTGDTYTLTKSGNRYHMNAGSFQYDYACDGKDYPTIAGETVSCKETATTLDSTYKQNGKLDQTTHRQLDASGKSYTSTSIYFRPDGGKTVTKTTFVRVGKGSGIAGTWRSTSTSSNHVGTFTMRVDGNSMHFESPEDRMTWNGKLDGTPAAAHGPDMPNSLMVSERSEGPNKIVTEVMVGGKHVWHSEDTMGADHKSYTEIAWDPDKPNEKQTYVYDKQ